MYREKLQLPYSQLLTNDKFGRNARATIWFFKLTNASLDLVLLVSKMLTSPLLPGVYRLNAQYSRKLACSSDDLKREGVKRV